MTVAAMFGFCILLINLPEMILGDENNPYAFTDRGYYELCEEQYETDNHVIY